MWGCRSASASPGRSKLRADGSGANEPGMRIGPGLQLISICSACGTCFGLSAAPQHACGPAGAGSSITSRVLAVVFALATKRRAARSASRLPSWNQSWARPFICAKAGGETDGRNPAPGLPGEPLPPAKAGWHGWGLCCALRAGACTAKCRIFCAFGRPDQCPKLPMTSSGYGPNTVVHPC